MKRNINNAGVLAMVLVIGCGNAKEMHVSSTYPLECRDAICSRRMAMPDTVDSLPFVAEVRVGTIKQSGFVVDVAPSKTDPSRSLVYVLTVQHLGLEQNPVDHVLVDQKRVAAYARPTPYTAQRDVAVLVLLSNSQGSFPPHPAFSEPATDGQGQLTLPGFIQSPYGRKAASHSQPRLVMTHSGRPSPIRYKPSFTEQEVRGWSGSPVLQDMTPGSLVVGMHRHVDHAYPVDEALLDKLKARAENALDP